MTYKKGDKLDFEIKNFCSGKAVERIKRQDAAWEKIFANHIFSKGLASRIYKELLKLKCKKKCNPVFLNGQKTSANERGYREGK